MKEYFKKLYNKTAESFYKLIKKNLKNETKQFIVTANPETFMKAEQDEVLNQMLLDENTTIVPDGIGIVKAAKMLNYDVKERIPGIDIATKLLEYGNEQKKSIYLFGAQKEVIISLKEVLAKDYPNLKIVGAKNGYEKDRDKVFKDIIKKSPDIVLVALGIPEQEKLIYKYLDKFKKGIFVGVGGSFDVISGHKKRAPKFFQKLNLEWLYRILKEPKRIKRFYDSNVKFIFKTKKLQKKNVNNGVIQCLSMIIVSLILTCISFLYTSANLDIGMYKSYFSPLLFLLNFLPIFIIVVLLSFVFKRLHISFLITSILVMILGIANQTKIVYRDDIVKFMDLSLLKEAMTMAQRYSIVIKKYTLISILLIIVIYFLLKKYVPKFKMKIVKQISFIILTIGMLIFGYKTLYCNTDTYANVGDKSLINVWITTRQYQIRGLVYPFVYTITDGIDKAPEGYDEKEAKNILGHYEYENLDDDKKVNIIAIMLEAYNDFSKFNKIDFTEDIYKNFHDIQKKSISGNLITSVFGGGTIDTERKFLTGYNSMPNFRKKRNSYVWYFKEQGYRTEAMHPIYGAFYNRASENPNIGFDDYYHYDNTYSKIQSGFMVDDTFFDYIISGFEKSKEQKIPYFNFSVTYQNHGPYSTETHKNPYFSNNGYSDEAYNTLNWYFHGIKQTNDALKKLIDYFENEEEPTIVILFGDHNPYLGENALAYNELGININMDSVDGFINYYSTPYIIYANESAKQTYDKSFVGKGNTISPIFLMNELFDYCELEGNQYMQYMSDLKVKVDVINNEYYKEDNNYIHTQDSKYRDLIQEYRYINYYYSRNYMDRSSTND